METAVTKQQLINALQAACNDYAALMQTNSYIQMQLQLSTKDMWNGLCYYLKHRHIRVATEIMEELSTDAGFVISKTGVWECPCNLNNSGEIKSKALAPRLELLQATLARLHNEQINQTHT